MPFWCGSWGASWGWFGWMFPLIGLLFMAMMAYLCFRMMRGCMAGHGSHTNADVEELRAGIRDLREEIRQLRQRS